MKTICITSFHPLISRNILGTQLLDLLQKNGNRIVLLVPEKKKDFFAGQFARDGIFIEPIDDRLTRRDLFLRYLALAFLDTRSLRIKRKTEMRESGTILSRIIGNTAFARWLLRFLSNVLTPRGAFHHVFATYAPDLIFATDVQNEYDVRLMHEAQRQSVPIVGMVRSWDNLTSKGALRCIPDRLVVHNTIVRDEAVRYSGVSADRIKVIGVPHYDAYIKGAASSREEFFKRIGGDPAKKLVLFAPIGDRYLTRNTIDRDILDILDKEFPNDWQILVRFPPLDTVANLYNKPPPSNRVFFDKPRVEIEGVLKNPELSRANEQHLLNSLYWSDMLVSGPSTMCVDMAFFDKPIVLFGFDGYTTYSYYEGVRRYYDYNHWRSVLQSGGAAFAETEKDFKKMLREAIASPQKLKEERRRIVEEQCFARDGKATERLAHVLLQKL